MIHSGVFKNVRITDAPCPSRVHPAERQLKKFAAIHRRSTTWMNHDMSPKQAGKSRET
jgi:hypothetical protein